MYVKVIARREDLNVKIDFACDRAMHFIKMVHETENPILKRRYWILFEMYNNAYNDFKDILESVI